MNNETAATKQDDNIILSKELINKVIEREKHIADDPTNWVTIDQLKKDLEKI